MVSGVAYLAPRPVAEYYHLVNAMVWSDIRWPSILKVSWNSFSVITKLQRKMVRHYKQNLAGYRLHGTVPVWDVARFGE